MNSADIWLETAVLFKVYFNSSIDKARLCVYNQHIHL